MDNMSEQQKAPQERGGLSWTYTAKVSFDWEAIAEAIGNAVVDNMKIEFEPAQNGAGDQAFRVNTAGVLEKVSQGSLEGAQGSPDEGP